MEEEPKKKKIPTLLVLCGSTENWYELLRGIEGIAVEQTTWDEMSVCSYSDSGIVVRMGPARNPIDARQKESRSVTNPALVLVRNLVRAVSGRLGHKYDFRNSLWAFAHAGIPMVNSFQAIYAELERPIFYGALLQVQKRLGADRFPLVPQIFYPASEEMAITPPYPIVVKASYPHAGFGKMRIANSEDFQDISGFLALHNTYASAEPLIDVDYELRIVKIGSNHYRAHKRIGCSWKVNTGASMREDVPMNERFKLWVDAASQVFGGLDILALDAVVDKSGKEWILEVNGSEMGLAPEHERESMLAMRAFVLEKFRSVTTCGPAPSPAPAPLAAPSATEIDAVNLRNRVAELELESADLSARNDLFRRILAAKPRPVKHFILGASAGCVIAFLLLWLATLARLTV